MFRSCPRNHPAPVTPSKPSFFLFKPLIATACLAIVFELLPIDFQHHIAPALVPYEDVYWASIDAETNPASSRELAEGSIVVEQSRDYTQNLSETSL
jgi:hypothetical protein